jgi:hypothetical protein
MPIIIDNSLGLQADPASTADFRNQVTADVEAGLKEGIPGIQFQGIPNVRPEADPTAATTEPVQPEWQTLTFEPKAAPPPPAPIPEEQEEERGFLHNLTRKLGNRAGKLLTDMTFNVADTAGDMAPDWMNAGIVFDENGIRLASGKDYDEKSLVANLADVLRDDQYKIVDHKDTRTFEDIKKSWAEGDNTKLAGDVAIFAIENGVTSIADMVAVMAAAPSYFVGLTSNYTQQRAANDGRDKPTAEDLGYGTATALVVTALERYGAEKVLGMIGDGSKTAVRKFLEGIAAETLTEAVQSPVEFAGEKVGTRQSDQVTPGALAEQSIAGALGGLGGGAIVGGTAQTVRALAGGDKQTAGAPTPGAAPTAPAAAATPPPAQPPSPPAGASPAPGAAPGPVPGGATLYQPEGAAGPTPVRVESIKGDQAVVTSLDADGNPLIVQGEPATYVVSTADLGAPKTTAKPEAAPQVQPGVVVTPLQPEEDTVDLPPPDPTDTTGLKTGFKQMGKGMMDDFYNKAFESLKAGKNTISGVKEKFLGELAPLYKAGLIGSPEDVRAIVNDKPSAEPLKDIAAQLEDMANPESSRKGVYLSHENVKNLNKLKVLGGLKARIPHVVNFDYRGGMMLFPTADSAAAATAQRKDKKAAELQALIGTLTGAGVNKPSDPAAVVVQQLTPEGAVTRESLVAPELVQATTESLAADGRTVQVVTPEEAQVRRAEGVAADNAQPPTSEATKVEVPPPATKTEEVPAPTAPATPKKPTSALGGLRGAMSFLTEQEKVPAGKKLARKLEERQQNAAMFAEALRAAAQEAAKKGAPEDVIAEANEAVRSVSKLADKSEYETRKGQGTGHAKVTSKVAGLLAAAEKLAKHYDEKVKPEEEKMAAYLKGKQQEPAKDKGDSSKSDEPAAPSGRVKEIKRSSSKKTFVPTTKAKSYVQEDAPAKPVQTVQPRPVEGAELKALFKDVGWDPQEIIEQAQKAGGSKRAGRGALARELARFLPEMNKPGSWLQYLAALKTSETLTFSERQRLFKAIEAFARADKPQEAQAAIVDVLNSLDKGPLDEKARMAVLEYANFRRAFEQLREDMEQIEAGDIVDDTDQELEDPNSYINEFDDGRLSNIFGPEGSHFVFRPSAGQKFSWRNAGLALKKLFGQLANKGAYSSRSLINRILYELRDQQGVEYFRAVLNRLNELAPDTIIRFTDDFPETKSDSVGLFDPSSATVYVRTDRTAAEQLQILIHELAHAATYYEMRSGNNEFRHEIEMLRLEVIDLAGKHFGTDRVAQTLSWYAGTWSGDKPPKDFVPGIYGLHNADEFVAEVLSNPEFHTHLLGLGRINAKNAPPQTLVDKLQTLIRKVFDEILKWIGFTDGPEADILRRSLVATDALMSNQARRGKEIAAKLTQAIADFRQQTGQTEDALRSMLLDGTGFSEVKLGAVYKFGAAERLRLERAQRETGETLSSVRDPRPLRNELNIRALVGDALVGVARATRDFNKSGAAEKFRKGYLSLYTFDQIERRMSRFFGNVGADNALTRLMDVRRKRQSHANVVLERAEKDVNAKWLKLSKQANKQLGQMMIDSTLWQIDPSKPESAQSKKVAKRKDFQKRYDKLKAQWNAMSRDQREIFEEARDFNTFLFNKIRRAAVELALDGLTDQDIPAAQRSLLYAARTPDEIDALVGAGKIIDIPIMNEQLAAALKDVMRITKIEGPYFTLRRHGDKVVEAEREGEETFASKDDADARADQIKSMTPKNKAVVKESEGGYTVKYKMHYVAFHRSRKDAEADADNLRQSGFRVEAVTEKTTSTTSPALTPALKELLSSAQRKLGGEGEGRAAISFALENAFSQILAERAASTASEMKRQGFAGVKADEMHMGFAERTHSTAWHYANMVTAKDEVRALTNLRMYAHPPRGSAGDTFRADQATMYQRGLVVNEVEKRIGIESQDFGQVGPVDSFFGKIGFAGYLMTPSYAFVNAMQNFTVAMPVIGAKYGYGRTSKAFARSMRAVAGPAFAKAFRGMAKKPGQITSYDIYQAIAEALKDDPRLAKWVQGDNSAIKQLVDLGVINASFTQELVSVAEGESRTVRKAFEYARLLPQGAEMFNRISTALAALELTKGDVNKTADLVRLTQIDYSVANQPRTFRRIGRVALPRSITMFKMYPQAIYNLLVGSVYDSITGAGASRAEAAKTLAGLMLTHTVAAGVIGGLLLEPLRLFLWAWNQIFGDEDKPYDLDTATRLFLADTFGDTVGNILARGVFTSVGLDLSTRLGLNHLAFYNPPDLTRADEAAWYKMIAEALGPVPSLLARSHTAFMKAWDQGRYRDAVAAAIPIKILQDANKAWNLVSEGITTPSGVPIVPGSEINVAQGLAKAAGFRTAEEANVADKRTTIYNYETWMKDRKSELFVAYWNATTPADRTKAVEQIKEFNQKNPGAAISKGDLVRSRRTSKQKAAQARGERIKNKDLRERLDY